MTDRVFEGFEMPASKKYRADFSARVQQARERAGYTQEFVSRMLGVPLGTWSKYEGGRGAGETQTIMPPELYSDFCELTGVSLDWLVAGRGNVNPSMRSRTPGAA